MPLFKDTVALEACPAKTAETISYGATFAVLGWLLASNYSGLGYAERDALSIASTDTDDPFLESTTSVEPTLDSTAIAKADSGKPSRYQTEMAIATKPALTPVWHENLKQFQAIESQPQLRAFSATDWNTASTAGLQIEAFMEGLALSRPPIESEFLLADFTISADDDLTSKQLAEAELIGEMTVKGAVTDRLSNRADKIQRPQIPRPYRAQQIQRSFVLPPRIQALRP